MHAYRPIDTITSDLAVSDLTQNRWGPVLLLIGTIVTVVVGIFTVLGYVRNWTTREVWYSFSAPLAVRTGAARPYGGRQVHMLHLALQNRSRQAVTERCFANDEPIVVELNVPVVEVVAVASCSSEFPPPPLPAHDGTTVRVGPAVLSGKQEVKIAILTSGRPADVGLRAQLTDVRLRPRPRLRNLYTLLPIGFGACLLLSAIGTAWIR